MYNKYYLGNKVIDGKPDIIIGGSPCQNFSVLRATSGNGNVVDGLKGDKSKLFYEYLRLLREINPKYFLLENVKTNVSKDQVVDYAKKAIVDNWANFEISQLTLPDQHTRCSYSSQSTAWIWIVDYPLAAQTLQEFLYNETNISLPDDRETAITIMGKKPS